jgi:hypothetical protein
VAAPTTLIIFALAAAWLAIAVVVLALCKMATRSDAEAGTPIESTEIPGDERGLATVTRLRGPAGRVHGERFAAGS